jgi:dTDP-4-dehydrorhamnose 3,5-epimerase
MIEGVITKLLVTHADDRGFFREIIRSTDDGFGAGFGQWSHSLVRAGVVKAWHGHIRQTQWTYVVCGVLKVALYDHRVSSATYRETVELIAGDDQQPCVYGFPPGILHGYRCLAGPAHVMYLTSDVYDPTEEVRIASDDPAIAYDWRAE